MNKIYALLIIILAALLLSSCSKETDNNSLTEAKQVTEFTESLNVDKTDSNWKTKLSQPPQLIFDEGKTYIWYLATTEGNIEITFAPDEAPTHVSNTIFLTQIGFYDDLIFHRVIPGFMAQGGDPLGTGRGDPGYKYDGEFSGKYTHDKAGTLSMANAGPGTDGSQFFITFKPTPFLDGKHTVFGYVTKGLDVLKKMEKLGSRRGQTSKEIKIIKATVIIK
ncbi:peptidylprolyl isomerase [Marinicella rhabdoformis]|uniref:peptidylprolyl isomerase n=1 Tax=Marinicella rhabdoformis TaxID=2580566 RepID=UPI0012AEC3D8|nr:peptidylprolyl isomerase [Marinicella rhabdoformis]